jgi:acetyl esterase
MPLPTIVWYHGGGWTTGSLETGDIVARALCSGIPAVVVSVAYRLSPEHPWPAAADDAAAALQWAAAHSGELGGDPARIAVGGDSAGGNIAAVAAQLARNSGPRLAAQILLYPVLDLDMDRSDRYPSLRDNADGYYVTRDELRWCVRNYLPAGADPADPRISPARHTDLASLPATVLAVAQYDPLRDQGTAYAGALQAASVPVTLHSGTGLIHGCFDMLGVAAAARDEINRVISSVRQALAVMDCRRR